jgi:LPXTG-motif cell wall-anchored protein
VVVQTSTTYTCTVPAPPAPAVVVPATGTGTGSITPPNTGDAGLADTSNSGGSWMVIVGGVLIGLAGFATFKFARR